MFTSNLILMNRFDLVLFIYSFLYHNPIACSETTINLEGDRIVNLQSSGYPMETPTTDFPSCEITVIAPAGRRIFVRFLEVILGPQNAAIIDMYDFSTRDNLVSVNNQFTRAIYSGYLGKSYAYYYDNIDTMGLEPGDEIGKKPIDILDVVTIGSKISISAFGFEFLPSISEAHDMFKFSIEISAVESVPKGKVYPVNLYQHEL